MRRDNSGCLTGAVAAFARIFLILIWIARPLAWNATFSTILVPCLGFLLLPFTTLMYFLLYTPGTGLAGLDWLWLGLAVVLDIASYGAAGATNRDRIPQGYPGALPPEPPPLGKPPAAAAM